MRAQIKTSSPPAGASEGRDPAGETAMRRLGSWLVVSFLSACSGDSGAGAGAGRTHIAVIPKGTTHEFWKTVEAGAREAAAELEIELVWKGPLQENDRSQQIQLVQQFTADRVAGIALAPLDHAALAGPVRAAREAGIPVVIFDSALDGRAGEDFASFVATDNARGGALAGEELARLVGRGAKVVVLRYQVGSASTEARETAFFEAAKQGGVEITVDNRYAGPTAGEAKSNALTLLDKLQDARGVFCSNESATHGMLLALRQAGLAGKLEFVGFDASPPLVEALKSGEIDALVVQNPRRMGREAVATLVRAVRGESVEPRVDTGVVLATRENMDQPEIAALLR
jgi:ribose transport system substrate-binding protein